MEINEKILKLKKNIVTWYPFETNSSILCINTTDEEIVNELKNTLKEVSVINSIEEQVDRKFDYIFMYAIEDTKYLLDDYIKFANNLLNENGTILFICDNKYGLQTCNVNVEQEKNEKNYLSKKQIEKILDKQNIKNYKFYYPLPNYKNPNVIFTDADLPDKESILRDLTLYSENEIVIFNEREKYKEIIKEDENIFPFFANSFVVEITNKENDIKYVSFNNSRKEIYRINTIMNNKCVYKKPNNKKAIKHFEEIKENISILNKLNLETLDSFEDDIIYSRIMPKEKQLDKIIINKFINENEDEAFSLMNKFIELIREKLVKDENKKQTIFKKYSVDIDDDTNKELNYTKYGLIDLIFQNCFYDNETFYFYDQEWNEENAPIEFIIYRAIEYLGNSSSKINKEKLFNYFNINEKLISIFSELEKKIQEEIKDEYIWKVHSVNTKTVKNVYDTGIHYRNLYSIELEEKENYDKKLKEKTNELRLLKNSRGWKLVENLRKIKRKFK